MGFWTTRQIGDRVHNTTPGFRDRLRIGRLAAHARLRAMRPRWRHTAHAARELVFVPSELHTSDPSFLDELRSGEIGLAGISVHVGQTSPFAINNAPIAWQRELHAFAWLRNLRAAGDLDAVTAARQLVTDWSRRNRSLDGIAAEAGVSARRVMAWTTNAGFLLESADAPFYRAFLDRLSEQVQFVERARRGARDGEDQLSCHLALLLASLALKDRDRLIPKFERRLLDELRRQVRPDGSHISRNPRVTLDLLVDLLPVRECYVARRLDVPPALTAMIAGMFAFLKAMRLGDGQIARFNGLGQVRSELLATVLALDPVPEAPVLPALQSGYLRLERGDTILIADCGSPPPLEFAGKAHAGCLSFEMSEGLTPIFVNSGAPDARHERDQSAARATASHSTLSLGQSSSGRLITSVQLDRLIQSSAHKRAGHRYRKSVRRSGWMVPRGGP